MLDVILHRFCRGNLRARDKLGRPRSRRECDVKMDLKNTILAWNGLIWVKTGIGGGLL
jgi:hypothetical protein